MEIIESVISGCFEIKPKILKDSRGYFVKIFNIEIFEKNGLSIDYAEEYYSVSHRNVVRGMHFQSPPMDHAKLVFCTNGKVMDVVLDLRVDSETYGCTAIFELSSKKANCIYIPKGMAHGFLTLSKKATMHYKVTSVYSQADDHGILWRSIGVNWPVKYPIISDRDNKFPELKDFKSPFGFVNVD